MTEIIIILLLVSGGIYVYRLAHRGWCRVSGQEPPEQHSKPLPIARFMAFLRDYVARIRGRLTRRPGKKDAPAESPEME